MRNIFQTKVVAIVSFTVLTEIFLLEKNCLHHPWDNALQFIITTFLILLLIVKKSQTETVPLWCL